MLFTCWEQGYPIKELSELFRRTESAIKRRLKLHGIDPRKKQTELADKNCYEKKPTNGKPARTGHYWSEDEVYFFP